ncbi:MAG: UDP-3-O-acyl-N-acetylglucosamine deacetylase [Parvularculaceae bacterium]
MTFLRDDERQRTVRSDIELDGVGLHSGCQSQIRILPAEAGAGISFRRVDLTGDNIIRAEPGCVVRSFHGTTIANKAGASVATIEHLMAAFALMGVDNAFVEIDGPELPILDGSAAPFLQALAEAGPHNLSAPRRALTVSAPLTVADGERSITFEPGRSRGLEIDIDFADCLIGRQTLTLDLDRSEDVARIALARTFCRASEVDALRQAGLIRGGSLDNSIVVDGARLLNEHPLRDPSEFALHKALDLVGDLHLVGGPFNGRIRAVRPGHDLNVRAALALAEAARDPMRAPMRASA